MIRGLNHGDRVCVDRERIGLYQGPLGATKLHEPFELPAQKVRVCFVGPPNSQIELLEPLGNDRSIALGLRKLRDKQLKDPWKKHDNIPL